VDNGSATVEGANCKSIKHAEIKQLRERATFFKRLAVGAADARFSAKLQALVDEYEGEAARVEISVETPAVPASSQAE
jgi:hypothetical protein